MDNCSRTVLAILVVVVASYSQAQVCERSCPFGFELDSRGNATCNCSRQTIIHEGECPVTSGGSFGICIELCAHDGDCSANQKCCSNGCGHACVAAVFPGKAGSCPVADGDTFGSCAEQCSHDSSCPGAQKCCSNGCGHTCMDPENGSDDYREGTCPLGALPNGTMGACADLCSSDLDCPSHHKCCSNGCGHVCMMANSLPVIHAGTCPAVDSNLRFGACVESCSNDGECAENEKCCSNGCGHRCQAAEAERVCPQVMCTLWCSHGFKQDSNGCNICECNPRTEIHSGECPAVASDQVGICVTTCDHDGSCPTNQKCCSNGCGHTCVDAVASVHTGTCPVGLLPEGSSGICSEMCSQDSECSPSQKCCSNGCGHVCITTNTTNEGNCPDVLCRLFCEYGFERDSNGCDMCSCRLPPGQHAGTCPVGLLPEGADGLCSESCSGDTDCRDSEKCCSNGCGHECVEVSPSNSTASCPDVMCMMWCEHGYRKDQHGCDTCYCNEEPVQCPDVLCMMYCPYGNEEDANGCPICRCKETPDHCPDVLCAMYCEHGFQRDQDGCEICVCSQPSEIRPGSCPVYFLPEGLDGTCVNMCDNDIECPTNQKCCSNGCGYACVDALDLPNTCPDNMCARYCPYGFRKDNNGCDVCDCNPQTIIHDGDCPSVNEDVVGLCAEMCEHDGNCSTNQKCCSNGCGHTCVEAVQSGTIKPGTCPAPDESMDGNCTNSCENDASCPANQKCCSNGCGRACTEPEPEVVRPGTCPVGFLPEGVAGACYEGCHNDGNCSTNQKCCSNGCGHSCITVIEEPVTCPDESCMMFCEFGFVRDDNGCETCVCKDPPSTHLGSCPASSSNGAFGICVESCYHDSDCLTNEKCCSNGCGHTCQAADDVPVIHPGTCPVGLLPEGVSGVCAELCSDDGSCSANEKCCSNGCGHVCVQVAPDCSNRIMCAMYCKDGYVKDDDGCDTCECLEIRPEAHEEPTAGAAAGPSATLYLIVLIMCLAVFNQY